MKPQAKNYHSNWNSVIPWYNKEMEVSILRLLCLNPESSLLDVGCGNGALARAIPKNIKYLGFDASQTLINQALDKNPNHKFIVADAQKFIASETYTHAAMILSLQNMKDPQQVIKNIRANKVLLVLNHPMFRIPRQSSWLTDGRKINRYITPLEIPITSHPGEQNSEITWTFHHSLSDYSKYAHEAGFTIDLIEEWVTDRNVEKVQKEFPLFMAILLSRRA
ncbi:MAG: class I SAM-dependent methyltransferase [Patescibacteria group bacterium]